MKKKLLSTFCLCFISFSAFAQYIDTGKLDEYFNALEKNNKFMGSVAVSQNGKLIYKRASGFSDIASNTKSDAETKFRIGSISKTFTSVLVLKAFEDSKLNLDQTIAKFFPTVKNANQITIRQLLLHRSGIYNFTDAEDYKTWMTQARTEKEMVEIIAKGASDFEPGTRTQYSNSNYVLLTYILEKTYNKPYSELLKTYIAEPAGLKNTYLGQKIGSQKNEARSFDFDGDWNKVPETDISIPLGAGGIVSTPNDLVQFSDALFGGKLLKKETLELMKPTRDSFGMGLMQIPFYEHIAYGHSGSIDKFTSVFSYFPDKRLSFALMSNGTNFDNNEISLAVLSAAYGKPFDIPDFKTFQISPEDFAKYLGVYASKQIPIKITISNQGNTLIAQAAGQSSFNLVATGVNKFAFEKAGIVLEFESEKKLMVLKQGWGEFIFTKE